MNTEEILEPDATAQNSEKLETGVKVDDPEQRPPSF
jgi:hypothetical protein